MSKKLHDRERGQNELNGDHEPETKLICGFVHYKVPCWLCNELIWTQHPVGNICNQCLDYDLPHVGNPAPLTPRSERVYNGSDV